MAEILLHRWQRRGAHVEREAGPEFQSIVSSHRHFDDPTCGYSASLLECTKHSYSLQYPLVDYWTMVILIFWLGSRYLVLRRLEFFYQGGEVVRTSLRKESD